MENENYFVAKTNLVIAGVGGMVYDGTIVHRESIACGI